MRILLLSNLYPPYVEGGAEILAGEIGAELARLGHEVIVLTSLHGVETPQRDGQIWRTLHIAPTAFFNQRRPWWQQLKQLLNYYRRYHSPANARELRRAISTIQPDVLYVWEITGIGVSSIIKTLPDLHVPIVFHLGSYWLLYARSPETEQSRLRTRWLKQWLIGTVSELTWTSLIAVSALVKEKYVQAGFDEQRIEVIHNGIDARFLAASNTRVDAASNAYRLLFVGRVRAEKGIMILLKALDLLMHEEGWINKKQKSLCLHIFGDGDAVYISELQSFLHERQLTSFVTFHGIVSQDELIEQYDRADMLLVPSLWQEPFGLVVLEAMARGLPVIASRTGGLVEIVTHEVNGLLVEPGNERELALAIRELLLDAEKRARLGQAGRATVQEQFTIEKNAQRVEQHLLGAIQRGQNRTWDMISSYGKS
ncbi:MAG TPA: glycosyltransferase family 4 protein [Ktedonobacteraceae bacterium]|nr:glycosyltransferase family 4 protein [Ktedonobacteraceae bacterium]